MTQIISIEGNIGSGKSTLLAQLKTIYAADSSICFLEEPVGIWNTITDASGTGATATATLKNGVVTAITVTNGASPKSTSMR